MGNGLRTRLKRLYIAALGVQTGGRGLRASLPGGEIVRVLPEFAHIGWNPDEYRAFRDAVRPGGTALDVGANVGGYSLLLGQWVGPNGSVHAFEPAPISYDGLVKHICLNNLTDVVHPVRSAVGRGRSVAQLVVAGTHGESRLAVAGDTAAPSIEVSVTTIDDYCEQHQLTPDFIKVDVEGWELDVLRGARETIRRCRGRVTLFVEMHPSVWPLIGVTRRDIEAELDRQSLAIDPIVPASDVWALEGICVRLVAR